MANVADISELLERVQSPDDVVRNEAERLLKQMEVEHYSSYLISLCATFVAEEKPVHIQRIAVIIFKNVLDSKEHETKVETTVEPLPFYSTHRSTGSPGAAVVRA